MPCGDHDDSGLGGLDADPPPLPHTSLLSGFGSSRVALLNPVEPHQVSSVYNSLAFRDRIKGLALPKVALGCVSAWTHNNA